MSLNSKKRTIVFSISGNIFSKGGAYVNFLNILKFIKPYFDKNGYKVIIYAYSNTKKDLRNNKYYIKNKSFLKGITFKFFKRIFPGEKPIYQFIELITDFLRFMKFNFIYKPDITYAYGDKSFYIGALGKIFYRYRLIFDIRGDYVNELIEKRNPKWKIKLLKNFEKFFITKTDLIFSVSNTYKYHKKSIKFIPKYNYYDGRLFRYYEEHSILKKNEMGLSEKFVFIYSGSTHYYQMIEEMVFFYSEFNKRHQDSFFIIISEWDKDEFIKYFKKYNVSSKSYSIYKLKHENINRILSIGDMAFLIRADLPLNHNAFPTKFAEYLASGVPVLTTPHIHTIAPIVIKNNLGKIIEPVKLGKNYDNIIDNIYLKYKADFKLKNRCSLFAQKELMWQNKAEEIFQIIDEV